MHEKKRKRLEANGWKLGTAQEFLGLSNEEAAYIDRTVRRAASLQKPRQRRRSAEGSANRRDL